MVQLAKLVIDRGELVVHGAELLACLGEVAGAVVDALLEVPVRSRQFGRSGLVGRDQADDPAKRDGY